MSVIATFAPIQVTVEFVFTDGDQVARASFDCPPGMLPTTDDIAKAAENIRAQVREQLGDAFDWQRRHAFVNDLLAERSGGMRFAIPGPDKFEAEWAA